MINNSVKLFKAYDSYFYLHVDYIEHNKNLDGYLIVYNRYAKYKMFGFSIIKKIR
jgi:hypothetical protein